MRFLTFAAAAPSANQPDIRLVTFSLRGNEKRAAPHVPGMLSFARHSYAPCSKTSRRGCVTPGSMLLVVFSLLSGSRESRHSCQRSREHCGIFRTSFRQRIRRRSRSPQRLLYRQLCITPFPTPTPSLFLLLCSGQGPIQEPQRVE